MESGKGNNQKNKLNILLTLFLFCVLINLFFMPKSPYKFDLNENNNKTPVITNTKQNENKVINSKEENKNENIIKNSNNEDDDEEIVYNKNNEDPILGNENEDNIINTNKDNSNINNNNKNNEENNENNIIINSSRTRVFFPSLEKFSIFAFLGIIFYLMQSNKENNNANEINTNQKNKKE
jgi:ATP-dependent Zn protease